MNEYIKRHLKNSTPDGFQCNTSNIQIRQFFKKLFGRYFQYFYRQTENTNFLKMNIFSIISQI